MVPSFSFPTQVPVTLSSEIADERLRRLAAYWYSKRGAYKATRRIDINPLEMPWILPFAWLYDHEAETGRFRCRLAGESVRDGYPVNIIGLYLDEFLGPEDWKAVKVTHGQIIGTPAIGHSRGRVYRPLLGRAGHVERLILPLSDESGTQATMVFGATIYTVGPSEVSGPAGNDPLTPRLLPID
jgi:hypothetical protein